MVRQFDMVRFRSVLAVLFTIVMVVLTFSIHPAEAARASKPPSYTAAQLEQIQQYVDDIEAMRVRMQELPPLMQQQEWIDVKNFIHGPLGELRIKMLRLARNLSPDAQRTAQVAAKDVFDHLILIDEAADARNTNKALRNYNEALKDFEVFFQALPIGRT